METSTNARFTCQEFLDQLSEDAYLLCNGRRVEKDALIENDKLYHICHRLRGGKGGFGSMLRTIGAQIEKTTNKEAMRDLSGRRMRDINNEKKLADWVAGASERDKQREERRKERLEKRRAEAEGRMHRFRDERYMEQKDQVSSNLDDALTQGIKRTATGSSGSGPQSKKGKAPATITSWAGLNMDDLSSSEEESSGTDDSGRGSAHVKVRAEVEDNSSDEPVDKSGQESTSSSAESDSCAEVNEGTQKTSMDVEQKMKDEEKAPEASITDPTNDNTEDKVVVSPVDASSDTVSKDISSQNISSDTEPIDLESHSDAEELEGCGLERLKQDLMRRGLKCGGSLKQRALRLYSVKGLSHSEINPSLFAKKKA